MFIIVASNSIACNQKFFSCAISSNFDTDSIIIAHYFFRSVILNEIPHDRCITVSDILKATHIPLQELQPLLLELELEGAIEHQPPRGYINMTRSDILVH